MAQLEDLMKDINKKFKKELAIKGIGQLKIKRIPFSSPRLNYETYGGIPRGRVTMFAGKESSGKSTTALDVVKNAQILFEEEWAKELIELRETVQNPKLNKTELTTAKERLSFIEKRGPLKVVYFDAEGTIDSDWARKLGVDVDNVYLVRLHTQTAEQFLDQVMRVVRDTDDVGLVIIDSIAVLVPQIVHGESFEQKNMGGNAKVVTDFCNEVCPILGEKDIACIVINQARDDFKNPYAEFSIPCGKGLKLASSLTLTFQKGRLLDEDGQEQKSSYECPQGNVVWVRIQKTKICKPDRRVGFYTLSYDYGVDVVADVIPLAVEFGLIKKAGAWYYIIDTNTGETMRLEDDTELKFQGGAAIQSYLRENKEVFATLNNYINSLVSGAQNDRNITIDVEEDIRAIEDCNTQDLQQDIVIRELDND